MEKEFNRELFSFPNFSYTESETERRETDIQDYDANIK